LDLVNASGGIDGHPVKLIMCYDQGDPNTSRTCADNAVSNPDVVATVAVFSNNDDIIDPIMEKAGIAQIGIDPQGATDPTCDVCFAFDGGGISDTVGLAAELHVFDGANKIDLEIPTVPVAQAEMGDAKRTLLAVDPGAQIQEQFVAFTVADYDPYVEASAGYQATALFTGGSQLVSWVKTAHSLGIKMDFGVLGCCITPQDIQETGGLLNGALVAADTAPPTSNVAGAVLYRSIVSKYAPKGTVIDQSGMYGWMSAKLFADVAKSITGPVTRVSLLAALRKLNGYTGFDGLIAPYTTTVKNTAMGGTIPDLYNTNLVPVRLEDGVEQVVSKGYMNVFTGKIIGG
jgi:ABC-type branched-subunit amino acid transport system substrate-binding protein